MSTKTKGSRFESEVCRYHRDRGWSAWRVLPSENTANGEARGAGTFDVIAIKTHEQFYATIRLLECKATKAGPFNGFGPAQREALLVEAERMRNDSVPALKVQAMLAWKKPRQGIVLIPSSDWPSTD